MRAIAGLKVDVTGYGDWSPAMTLAVTERNRAGSLSLHLIDAGGTSHIYGFELRKLKPNTPQQLVADYGASLAEPPRWRRQAQRPAWGQIAA